MSKVTFNTETKLNATQQEQRRLYQERNSMAYLNMEHDVHEVGRMASATVLILELYNEHKEEFAKAGEMTSVEMVKHTDKHWGNAVDFMVRHLHDMVHNLQKHY